MQQFIHLLFESNIFVPRILHQFHWQRQLLLGTAIACVVFAPSAATLSLHRIADDCNAREESETCVSSILDGRCVGAVANKNHFNPKVLARLVNMRLRERGISLDVDC